MKFTDAYTSALKISAIIGVACLPLGPLDLFIFLFCLLAFTIGIYIYRSIRPPEPIWDIFEIEDICKDFLKKFLPTFKKRLPLTINDKTTFADIYINDKKLVCTYTCYYSDEKDLPNEESIKNRMYAHLNKDSSFPLVFIALVYLHVSWMIRFKCLALDKNIEVMLSPEEIKEKVSKWHEFGEENRSDWE